MPNKTIYVRDAELWKKAKAIAGKEGEGLSGVIAEALAAFVKKHEAAAEGQVVHRFTVHDAEDPDEPLERVAFAGREIGSRSFPTAHSPADVFATVYATRGGQFVLTVGQDDGSDVLSHYAVYSHPQGIAQDRVLLQCGDKHDIQNWAGSIYLRHFEETATETWVE